jgi:RNA polymerase sigma factor (sigma-70 family)
MARQDALPVEPNPLVRWLRPDGGQQAEAHAQVFTALYQEHYRRVHNYLCYQVGDADLAEDLAAEVFARAWRRLPDLRKPESAAAWLFVIARNLVVDRRRRATPLPEPLPDEIPDCDGHPESRLLAVEQRVLLRECLAELNDREREIVGLRFVAGLQNRQIAPIIGTSEGNVAKILHRALAKVRERLHEEERDV